MASHTSLRQASRIIQSNKSYLTASSLRQSFNSHALLSSRTTSFSRRPILNNRYLVQQSRNLSWWGSSASSSQSTPTSEVASTSNINISEPSDLRNIISPDRAFKASPDFSSAELHDASSTPHTIEPQFVADIQNAVAEPHLIESSSLPTDIEDVPERIGYLKEVCGLDFGWGPSSIVETVLEHLHITAGYSWTASIVLLGFTVRAMIFPLMVRAAKETQKIRDANVVIQPIQAEYTAAKDKGDRQKMVQAAQQLMAVRKEFNIRYSNAFMPMLVQIPFGFGCWRVLRNAAEYPVPGFITESWLWTSDLTFSDPFYIVPLLSGFLVFLTFTMNSRVSLAAQQTGGPFLKLFLAGMTFVFTSLQPGAVQLYFLTASCTGLVTAFILQQTPVRRTFNMPALQRLAATPTTPSPTGSASATPTTPPSTIAGLNLKPLATRAAEAKEAARLAAEQAERMKKISTIDKVVDSGKKLKGTVETFVKGEKVVSILDQFRSIPEDKKKQSEAARAEEYEARVRAQLDEKRRQRNERMGGR